MPTAQALHPRQAAQKRDQIEAHRPSSSQRYHLAHSLAKLRQPTDNTSPNDSPDNHSADAKEAEEVVPFLFEDDNLKGH